MRKGIGDTVSRLRALAKARGLTPPAEGSARLRPLAVTSDPGQLGAWQFVPSGSAKMPLVVVLHGCTQNAASYDQGSGWSALAERFGFAVLFPEQQRANNGNLCFNWFEPGDTRRGKGEAASIRAMVAAMVKHHPIDPARIFVTGLSAGGAMSSVMLACYPEVFAGGAIIAGLPFGAARSVPEAFDRMRGSGHPDAAAYAAMVRRAAPHPDRWPTVAVWHGTADATVAAMNADAIIGQWRSVHGAAVRPDRSDRVHGFPHRVWHDADGRDAIEEFVITGMGHGTPIATHGAEKSGSAMPHMLDVGISSTWRIAQGWGLLGKERAVAAPATQMREPSAAESWQRASDQVAGGVQATIEAALRSAGLMR